MIPSFVFHVEGEELTGHKVQSLPLNTKFSCRELEYIKHTS